MSTYTQNYQLHQWVPEDNFLRTDFNEDFAKIDKAIKEALTAAGAAQSAANTAQSAADAAQSTAGDKIALTTGSYTGDGAETRTVSLGFQPKAILVERRDGVRHGSNTAAGLALDGKPCYANATTGGVTITATGFTVSTMGYTTTNQSGTVFYYLALR